jgi:RNA polymerase sigma-70 factor (ECF subfamily)
MHQFCDTDAPRGFRVETNAPAPMRASCGAGAGWLPIVTKAVHCYGDYLKALADRGLAADLRPKGDASDVVQETFAEVYREYHRFEGLPDEDFKALLTRMMLNNLKSFTRLYRGTLRREIGREVSLEDTPTGRGTLAQLEAPGESPGEWVSRSEELQRLKARIAQLPERDRLALTWRAREGRSYREIGDRLGCSPVAARKLCLRVVDRLRRDLRVATG